MVSFGVCSRCKEEMSYFVVFAHLPKVISSARIMEPKTAVMIMQRGLKAVTYTGPLSFITMPCT